MKIYIKKRREIFLNRRNYVTQEKFKNDINKFGCRTQFRYYLYEISVKEAIMRSHYYLRNVLKNIKFCNIQK